MKRYFLNDKKQNDHQEADSQSIQQPFWKNVFGGMIGALAVIIVAGLFGFALINNDTNSHAQPTLSDFDQVITDVVSRVQDSVVTVANYQQSSNPGSLIWGSEGLEITDLQEEPTLAGTGSGVIYKIEGDDAYIVTNNHVIDGASAIEIELRDGSTREAELIGSDAISDLAVLKVAADGIETTLPFANSDDILVGQMAIAIGSPIGSRFASSVTQGIVSGLDRSVPVDTDGDGKTDWEMTLIQTDAAINPGNSGGALVNSQGELMGINSSKYASAYIDSMGFATPSNEVQHIISMIEEFGHVIRPILGVGTYDLNVFSQRSLVEDLGLPEGMRDGALVAEVAPDSSAYEAGIEQYDVITAINGETVENGQALRNLLYQYEVGDTVTITLYRAGQEIQVDVTLNAQLEQSDNATILPPNQ